MYGRGGEKQVKVYGRCFRCLGGSMRVCATMDYGGMVLSCVENDGSGVVEGYGVQGATERVQRLLCRLR